MIGIHIYDINEPLYLTYKPISIINSAKYEKKKYLEPCIEQRRYFTPFVVSCEYTIGKETDVFLKWLSKKLAEKWHRPYA